ncbi:MAG: DUF418 domain-containing protein [Pseudomonadota bacterium]
MTTAGTGAPIAAQDRITELDALRGFALLGVFIVHFVGLLHYEVVADEQVRETWMAAPYNRWFVFASDWLFENKANTLFATLFGFGFWIQMTRLEGRGAAFQTVYLRRLTVLLAIGLINWIFVFPGDVLHEYALLGFVLFLCRRLPERSMLLIGIVLALAVQPILETLFAEIGLSGDIWDDKMAAAQSVESYSEWVSLTFPAQLMRDIALFGFVPWGLYLLGRFFFGAWAARQDVIGAARRNRRLTIKATLGAMAIGLVFEYVSLRIFLGTIDAPDWLDMLLHALGAPILALSYAGAVVLVCHSARLGWIARLLSPVGRTALTSYVAHGALLSLLIWPFGLDLRDAISPLGGFLIATGFFGLMTLASHFWLQRYRFGPLEWLWRGATYGEMPALRHSA